MRRAAVSISSNIAEGSARIPTRIARFVECDRITVRSSLGVNGASAGYLSDDSFAAIYKAAEQQGRMLSGLRRTLVGN